MGSILVLSGIAGLLTGIVLLIVGVAGGHKKLTLPGVILAIAGVLVLIYGIYYSVSSVVDGVKNAFTNTIEKADSIHKAEEKLLEEPEDNWASNDALGNQSVAYLKSLVPDSIKPFVKKRYFRKIHDFSFSRYPVSFPYAIHQNTFEHTSVFTDERALMDTRATSGVTVNKVLNVTHLVFDEKMILMKTADYDFNSNTNNGPPKFFLFEFGKDGLFEFVSEKELTEAATKNGYKGSFDFFTVAEYSGRFN